MYSAPTLIQCLVLVPSTNQSEEEEQTQTEACEYKENSQGNIKCSKAREEILVGLIGINSY